MRLNPFKKSPPAVVAPSPVEAQQETEELDLPTPTVQGIDVVADMLYRSCWPRGWMPSEQVSSDDWTDEVVLGVSIRLVPGHVCSHPTNHAGMVEFEQALTGLNACVGLKMRCTAVDYTINQHIDPNPGMYELYINANVRIQVLDSLAQLPSARRSQYAAFIRDEAVLVIWADSVDNLVPTATAIEAALVKFIWSGNRSTPNLHTPGLSTPGINTPRGFLSTTSLNVAGNASAGQLPDALPVPESGDVEKGISSSPRRQTVLIAATVSGLSVLLLVVLMGLGVSKSIELAYADIQGQLLVGYIYDQDASRWALVVTLPVAACLAAFPCCTLVSSLLYMVGPISQTQRNSKTFSAIAPSRDNVRDLLPITVQVPVYKESLEDVIVPTIESLKVAVTTFERQGGSVNVVICDDGLQLLSPADRQARIEYYTNNDMGYVARPPAGVGGFERRGKFKKAGNLNHMNMLSLEVEEEMDLQRPALESDTRWGEADEKVLYEECLQTVLAKRELLTIASGNIRIGEIILLIDSDTRVPADCFMDASLEMMECPDVAIIQHESGVMQVAHHFFENAMAFFTDMIQLSIGMTVGGGDVAPFVGHNAFLRWSALQEVSFVDDYDGKKRAWSEEHVSEDFQMSLSLHTNGWTTRWATYSKSQFQEGVSLTCTDELSRWQKYAWGCSEIVFNPLRYWPTRGPFTKLFRQFLSAPIPPGSKFSMLAYMFSYYAISSAWIGTLISFVLIGVFARVDPFYVTSWMVFFTVILLFTGLNNLSTCVLRFRLKMVNSGRAAIQQLMWMPFFAVFFSGLSLPISVSLVCHLLGISMSWTSTSKSVEQSNFFLQLPKIFRKFYAQLGISVVVLAGTIVSTTQVMPAAYRVTDITSIIPLAITYGSHLLWPFVLDPYLTTFTY